MKLIFSLSILFFIMQFSFCQNTKDTIYICFNENELGMRKNVIDKKKLIVDGVLPKYDSYTYLIKPKMNEDENYQQLLRFTHFNWSKKKKLLPKNYKAPKRLIVKKSFIDSLNFLTNDFFKKTHYKEVYKLFDKNNDWKQDVTIYIYDYNDTVNDNYILREVSFSRY